METRSLRPVEWFAVFLLASLQLLTMVKSGGMTVYGLSFWGPHGHDAVFHLSLIRQFADNPFSFSNPLIAGEALQNYHLAYDYLLGWLVRLTGIGAADWYFRLMPAFISGTLGILVLGLLKNWGYSLGARLIGLSLVYWGGSLGHLVSLAASGDLWAGESRFWATQAISTLINPPFAASLVLLVTWLLGWKRFLIKPEWKMGMGLVGLIAILFQTKAYAAFLLASALVIATFWEAIAKGRLNKAQTSLALTSLAAIIISVLVTTSTTGIFQFQPLYLAYSLLASPDRLNLPTLAAIWDNFASSGQAIKLSLLQLTALAVFVVGNFGVRLLAFSEINTTKIEHKLLGAIIGLGIILPLLFVQRGTAWNTIQFMYYSLFVAGLMAAPAWARLFGRARNIFSLAVLGGIFIFLAFPTTYGTLRDYLSPTPATYVSASQLRALSLINDGIVITPVYDPDLGRKFFEPKPLYVYESTAYIAALSSSATWLSDEVNLTIMAYDFSDRRKDLIRFYATSDKSFREEFLKNTQASWVFNPYPAPEIGLGSIGWTKVFDSGVTNLYTQSHEN